MKVCSILATIACFGAAPLAAQAPTTSSAAPDTKHEKSICRSSVATGSIMPGKRVCHTAREWSTIDADEAAANASFLDRAGNNAIPR